MRKHTKKLRREADKMDFERALDLASQINKLSHEFDPYEYADQEDSSSAGMNFVVNGINFSRILDQLCSENLDGIIQFLECVLEDGDKEQQEKATEILKELQK